MGAAYVNPSDTTAITNTTNDGTHPSAYGACKMGEIAANELKKHIPLVPAMSYSIADPFNLNTNGAMVGTGGTLINAAITGVVADGWFAGGYEATTSVTASKAARTDVLSGEWQQFVVANGGTTGSVQFYKNVVSGFTAGTDKIYGMIELEVDSASVITERIDMLLEARTGAGNSTVLNSFGGLFHESANPNLNYAPKGTMIIRSPEFIIPATTTQIRLICKAYMTSGTIKVGRS